MAASRNRCSTQVQVDMTSTYVMGIVVGSSLQEYEQKKESSSRRRFLEKILRWTQKSEGSQNKLKNHNSLFQIE